MGGSGDRLHCDLFFTSVCQDTISDASSVHNISLIFRRFLGRRPSITWTLARCKTAWLVHQPIRLCSRIRNACFGMQVCIVNELRRPLEKSACALRSFLLAD